MMNLSGDEDNPEGERFVDAIHKLCSDISMPYDKHDFDDPLDQALDFIRQTLLYCLKIGKEGIQCPVYEKEGRTKSIENLCSKIGSPCCMCNSIIPPMILTIPSYVDIDVLLEEMRNNPPKQGKYKVVNGPVDICSAACMEEWERHFRRPGGV